MHGFRLQISQDFFVLCLTPQAGFEPATNRLTVDRSTTELLRNAPITYLKSNYRIWQVLLEKILEILFGDTQQSYLQVFGVHTSSKGA